MTRDRLQRQYTFTCLPEHLIRDTRISDRAVRLWCLLDRHAGAGTSTFPTRGELATEIDCSRESVDRALRVLREHGWLMMRRQAAGDVNEYTLTIPEQPLPAPLVTGDDTPPRHPRQHPSSPMTTPVVTGDAHIGKREERGENPPFPPQAGGVDNPSRCARHRRPRRGCTDCQLPPLAPVPDHCGACGPNRRVEDGNGDDAGPCPACHPSVVRPA